ncbi:MAG: hypothetical protein LBE31_04155, partial [Deltaproteobacteria bacterium]|nr:hypothetical protein [Deltaproteobacteria bacterium]
ADDADDVAVYDVNKSEVISYIQAPPHLGKVIYANFIDENSFVLTWLWESQSKKKKYQQKKYFFDYFTLAKPTPVLTLMKENKSLEQLVNDVWIKPELVSRYRTGQNGWVLYYDAYSQILEIHRLNEPKVEVKKVNLPSAKLVEAYVNSDATRGLFHFKKESTGSIETTDSIELWDIENQKPLWVMAWQVSDDYKDISLLDVNFNNNIILVNLFKDNEILNIFNLNGQLICQQEVEGLSQGISITGNIIFLEINHTEMLHRAERKKDPDSKKYLYSFYKEYEFRFIDIYDFRTLQTVEHQNGFFISPNFNFYKNLLVNNAIILGFDSRITGEPFEVWPKPGFGFKANWALSVIESSQDRIENDIKFNKYLSLANQSYDQDDIESAIINLNNAKSIMGYQNDQKCSILHSKLMKFCRFSKINGIKKNHIDLLEKHNSLVFVPNFGYLSLGSSDGTDIYSPDDGALMYKLKWQILRYFSDGQRAFAYSGRGHTLQIVDCPWTSPGLTIKEEIELEPGLGEVINIHISPDERYYALEFCYVPSDSWPANSLYFVRIYEMGANKLIFSGNDKERTYFIGFSLDSSYFIIYYNKRTFQFQYNKVINLNNGKTEVEVPAVSMWGRVLFGEKFFIAESTKRLGLFNFLLNNYSILCDYDDVEDVTRIKTFDIFAGGSKIAAIVDNNLEFWDINSNNMLSRINVIEGAPGNLCINESGDRVAVLTDQGCVVYNIEWDLDFPGWASWDEGAKPFLQTFLKAHPDFSEDKIDILIRTLQNAGYGYLKKELVRAKLDELQFGW